LTDVDEKMVVAKTVVAKTVVAKTKAGCLIDGVSGGSRLSK
jgi:hypothetical protein